MSQGCATIGQLRVSRGSEADPGDDARLSRRQQQQRRSARHAGRDGGVHLPLAAVLMEGPSCTAHHPHCGIHAYARQPSSRRVAVGCSKSTATSCWPNSRSLTGRPTNGRRCAATSSGASRGYGTRCGPSCRGAGRAGHRCTTSRRCRRWPPTPSSSPAARCGLRAARSSIAAVRPRCPSCTPRFISPGTRSRRRGRCRRWPTPWHTRSSRAGRSGSAGASTHLWDRRRTAWPGPTRYCVSRRGGRRPDQTKAPLHRRQRPMRAIVTRGHG